MLDKESGWKYLKTLNLTPDDMGLPILEVTAKKWGDQISSKKKKNLKIKFPLIVNSNIWFPKIPPQVI